MTIDNESSTMRKLSKLHAYLLLKLNNGIFLGAI